MNRHNRLSGGLVRAAGVVPGSARGRPEVRPRVSYSHHGRGRDEKVLKRGLLEYPFRRKQNEHSSPRIRRL